MLGLLSRRLIQMVLIMAVASLILFLIFDTEDFKKKIAVAELGGFAVSALSEESYQNWLVEKGLDAPFYERFVNWVRRRRHAASSDTRSRRTPRSGHCSSTG